jgi:Flp pilus assembly protein CpaB
MLSLTPPESAKVKLSAQPAPETLLLRARDEITESKEKNPAAGRNAGKESGVYA